MAPLAKSDKWKPKSDSVKQLMENDPIPFHSASEMLLRIGRSIVEYPNVDGYRKVNLSDENVEKSLLPVHGAMLCLFEMGFVEDGNCLTLPKDTSLTAAKHICEEIGLAQRQISQPGDVAGDKKVMEQPTSGSAGATKIQVPYNKTSVTETKFAATLHSSYNHVLIYENSHLQQKARDCVPVADLEQKTTEMAGNCDANNDETRKIRRDFFIVALLDWFKNVFFTWVDSPKCTYCGSECRKAGAADPLPSERKWGGNRVEIHQCSKCERTTRFPRYNHPEKLLETRSGRCGEWANCFTLICVSFGYDSRYVLDWGDHVWTEVFSELQQRWLHCDPCENICDKPLLYEKGWGKKLTYVIGFSKDDIQDVTWRYSKNHKETLARRTECRERWLVAKIMKLRNDRMSRCSPARREMLQKRLVSEIIELMVENSTHDRLRGRTTGSLAWRQQRGEMGDGDSNPSSSYTFKLTDSDVNARSFHVRYSSCQDKYVRLVDGRDVSETKHWKKCVFESENITRKVESDWKMTYLAREENTQSASVTWMFDFTGSGLTIDTIDIVASSTCYETGTVRWMLCNDDICVPLSGGEHPEVIRDLRGFTSLKLTAHLRGGKGDNAWQHTQLFRQKLNSTTFPLDVKIRFMPEK